MTSTLISSLDLLGFCISTDPITRSFNDGMTPWAVLALHCKASWDNGMGIPGWFCILNGHWTLGGQMVRSLVLRAGVNGVLQYGLVWSGFSTWYTRRACSPLPTFPIPL